MHFLIINGPNLHNIGLREPEIYGNLIFDEFFNKLQKDFPNIELDYFQSHIEGEIIQRLHKAENESLDGVILNAGSYTHSSVGIRDAISAIDTPVVIVHISNVYARETFRSKNIIAKDCYGVIAGFGLDSYKLAVLSLSINR